MPVLVLLQKEVIRFDKTQEEATKTISHRVKPIDNSRFMASSLSDLVNNLAEGIHKAKCKYRHKNKNCESCEIKYKYCECCFNRTKFKDNLCCNKNYKKNDETLKN